MDKSGNPNSVIDSHQNSGESTTNTEAQNQDAAQAQIDWEKRFKDTQAAFTKSRQELAATKAELQAAKEMQQFAMPADVKARLDELKFSDPDAWRVEMNAFEQSKTVKFNEPKNAVFSSTINSFRCGNGIPLLFARVDNKQNFFVKSY